MEKDAGILYPHPFDAYEKNSDSFLVLSALWQSVDAYLDDIGTAAQQVDAGCQIYAAGVICCLCDKDSAYIVDLQRCGEIAVDKFPFSAFKIGCGGDVHNAG